MEIRAISIKSFKKIRSIFLKLRDINYLVGGNNSGKSSVLQAIHTAITAAQSQVENGDAKVLAEEQLRYSPTGDFCLLGNASPFENRTVGKRATIEFIGDSAEGAVSTSIVELYKGRNNRNVGIRRFRRGVGFGQLIWQVDPPFSVYVPGLAGIPHFEEFKNEGLVLRKVAGGDANLVLRNVLLLLQTEGKFRIFIRLLNDIFDEVRIRVRFDPNKDQFINVEVSIGRFVRYLPLDMVGTGVLQAIQIFAYATLFEPKLLLLDEPDAHLHPSNQALLVRAFELLVETTSTKIILATHSRHLINAAPSEAKFFWLDNGALKDDGDDIEAIKLLMDLGALDDGDKILNSEKEFLILVEDENTGGLKFLLENLGEDLNHFDLVPYSGVSKAVSAAQLVNHLRPMIRGERKIIIHRDRDFLTAQECQTWRDEVARYGVTAFITESSDLEAYAIDIEHLSEISGREEGVIEVFLRELIDENDAQLRKKFRAKRRDANLEFHRDGGGPHVDTLCPPSEQLAFENVLGKALLKLIRANSEEKLGQRIDPLRPSPIALAEDLQNLITELRAQ